MEKYFKFINTFFVVAPMTFIMAIIAIYKNHGFEDEWVKLFFSSWLTMLPAAYLTAFVIIPWARKCTQYITNK